MFERHSPTGQDGSMIAFTTSWPLLLLFYTVDTWRFGAV